MRRPVLSLAIAIPAVLLLGIVLYNLPPVHERLVWRVSELRSKLQYAINPPEEVVFIPGSTQIATPTVLLTRQPSFTPTRSASPTPAQTGTVATPLPSVTATLTPTPVPGQVLLGSIIHEYQKWNNCGPANLAMQLSFWGWQGDQLVTAAFLKPNPRDKNVMPYEMAAFVEQETDLQALVRYGGDQLTLKRFIAAGFPVIVEKGFEGATFDGWMGHYEVVNGYDDALEQFDVQDSYLGPDLAVPYADMESQWRAFNYTYILVFPADRQTEISDLLGAQANERENLLYTAEKASAEIFTTEGRDRYFAWYNRGSSLVLLQDYAGAAQAYDEAFALYSDIPETERPWRMVWYQTGPYFAYFYSGRYYDVLNLADTAIETATEPSIEESFYWRAMAKAALGDTSGAITDFRASLEWHPGFQPSTYQLELMGETP